MSSIAIIDEEDLEMVEMEDEEEEDEDMKAWLLP